MHAAGLRLAEEQARSDALLYQMLPRVVADKLRKGASCDAPGGGCGASSLLCTR